MVAQLHKSTATEQRLAIEELIGIDDNVVVCAFITEEEVLAKAESTNRITEEENGDHQVQFQPTTLCEAINALTVLQKFVAFYDDFNADDNY